MVVELRHKYVSGTGHTLARRVSGMFEAVMTPWRHHRLERSPTTKCSGSTGGVGQDRRTQPERSNNAIVEGDNCIAYSGGQPHCSKVLEVVVELWRG